VVVAAEHETVWLSVSLATNGPLLSGCSRRRVNRVTSDWWYRRHTVKDIAQLMGQCGVELTAVSVGEWMMNSCVEASYVAVVSSPRRNVPCPSSVCAYVPITCSDAKVANR
jgi:hypothetical protein